MRMPKVHNHGPGFEKAVIVRLVNTGGEPLAPCMATFDASKFPPPLASLADSLGDLPEDFRGGASAVLAGAYHKTVCLKWPVTKTLRWAKEAYGMSPGVLGAIARENRS